MKEYPLAIYTADHGLAWTYPRSEISFAEIDACRKAFGPLPDFDAGAKGYAAVWASGQRVFVMRCQSVAAWDFRGRSATYLAVTWFPRAEAATIDFEKLIASPSLSTPTKNPPSFFSCDATVASAASVAPEPFLKDGFRRVGGIVSGAGNEATVAIKRIDGNEQASCSVSLPKHEFAPVSSKGTSGAGAACASERIGSTQSGSSVTFVIIIALILALAAAVFGMKWYVLKQENSELRKQLEEMKLRESSRARESRLPWAIPGMLAPFYFE